MQETIVAVVCVVGAYLMGSLPFGYWIGKLAKGRGFDIRDHGSCSIGCTNVLRVLGWKVALPVLILDVAKGRHRSKSSAFFGVLTPKIEGHFWSFFNVFSREHLPFKCLKGLSQSVKFLVLLRTSQAFNQRPADL